MPRSRLEDLLAYFTLGALVFYVPIETWFSLPFGLIHPMYIVDVIGMILLLFGALHSLKARPQSSIGPLAVGWAWSAANGWRATSWRYLEVRDGGTLGWGQAELIGTAVGTLVALICLAMSLKLSMRRVGPDSDG